MSAYNIVVNDVQKTKNKFLCLARIDNYRNVLKHLTTGESIRTDPFPLDFDSIGTSTWTLIFYPKGQYIASSNSNATESGQVSMYLKMVDCEHQNSSLDMTIRFFIKSPYCDVLDKFSVSKYATFSYRNLTERWSGPFDLAAVKELYSSRCKNLFLNDSLTLGCELDDTMFHLHSPLTRFKENAYVSDASYTDEEHSLNIGRVWKDNSLSPCTPKSYTDDSRRSLTGGFQIGDTTFQSSPWMESKGNAHSAGKSYKTQNSPSVYPRTPRTTLQPRESSNISIRSYGARKHALPVDDEPNNKISRTYTPRSEMQPKEKQNRATRTSIDSKPENVDESWKKSLNIGSESKETASHQTIPRVHSKENARRTSTFNTVDESKVKKNQKEMTVQELSSALQNISLDESEKEDDSFKENEKEQPCSCRNSNEKRSKETQTWSEVLRACSEKGDNNGTTDNVHQLTASCRVKSQVAFFEKIISSKD